MDLLLELSLDNLLRSTEQAFPGTDARQNNVDSVAVKHVELIPADGTLIAKGTVRGSKGQEYPVVIEFQDVTYNPEDNGVAFVSNGNQYTIAPLSRTLTHCKVACRCLDFQYRFAQYNDAKQALASDHPPLYSKRPGSNRGPANPTHAPGMCKHLIDFSTELAEAGLFT